MEDSEIMEWQPVQLASSQHVRSHHQYGIILEPDYDSMVGMIVRVRPIEDCLCALCCGRCYEVHKDDLARIGITGGYFCEHQILAD